jgi:hypothetical protein
MKKDRTVWSKHFWNKEKTNLLIPKSSRLKRLKEVSYKNFQEQRGTKKYSKAF